MDLLSLWKCFYSLLNESKGTATATDSVIAHLNSNAAFANAIAFAFAHKPD